MSLVPNFRGRWRGIEDRHKRLLGHIEKLSQNKIDVCEDRLSWLEWCRSHSGTDQSTPSLLVVNFTENKSPFEWILSLYKVEEVMQQGESLEPLSWLLEKKAGQGATTERKKENGSDEQTAPAEGTGNAGGTDTESPTRSFFPVGYISSSDCSNRTTVCPTEQASSANAEEEPTREIPDAILLVCGTSITVVQELIAGTLFLQGRPVVILAEGAEEDVCTEAMKLTAGTWPVFNSQSALLKYLENDLPSKLGLRKIIHQNIYALLAKHKKVDLTWYAITRGALALVPFGVHALNTASLFDLCRQCMVDAGMRADKQAQKAVATGAGKAGIVEFACNSTSDVYQLLVEGVILTEMVEAGSVAAAMATLDLADAFLLGSISVVTGAVAAVTAYMSRPRLVDSIADVMVMLQYTYCINPQLRRNARPSLEVACQH